jgi:cystathionine beta-lyase/cystathionine gamma-synthase
VQEALGQHKGYEYARTQNPTRAALEANIAAIEGGTAGFAFASGMAAEGAIMTLLKSGDHVVVTDNTYGGTYRLFEKVLRKYQLDFSYVDTSDTGAIEAAMRPETRMLFLETPTNPVLRITDLRRACDIAHAHNAVVVVDNTFASPYIQRPIEFGADLVVHSTTKFLNGHSDSVGGVVVHGHPHELQAFVAELGGQRGEGGHLFDARAAPRGPDVDDTHLALPARERRRIPRRPETTRNAASVSREHAPPTRGRTRLYCRSPQR